MIDCLSPLVTIVIPVFNVEEYIVQCIQSVMAQSYKNIEILCIDDQGTDRSMDAVSTLALLDKRIRVLKHVTNLGLGSARNTGIGEARGEFIYFLDADDWIKPKTIESLVAKAISEDADIVIGSAFAFSDNGLHVIEEKTKSINKWLNIREIPKSVSIVNFYDILEKIPCVAWGKLYKSDFLRKNNLEFIDKSICHEDDGFHVKCMSCEPRISYSRENGYQYRIRSSSLMNFDSGGRPDSDMHKKISIEDALDYLKRTHKNVILSKITKDFYWRCFAFKWCFVTFYWGCNSKLLKVWRISLIKQMRRDGEVKICILGVPIWKKIVSLSEQFSPRS